ncbi:MAG: sugar transferase, partial [Bacteroidota bacterium]|nr:sugar transferase [Bacteroidota bacterium]
GDFIALNAAWAIFFWLRVDSGWFVFRHAAPTDVSPSLLPITSLEIYLFWMAMFLIFGLYRPWYVRPPFDEIVTLLKTLGVGTIILSLIIWWDSSDTSGLASNDPRVLGLTYWCITASLCVSIRLLIRHGQRRLLESGVGRRPSIIVGEPEMVRQLAGQIAHYPRLGYEIIGFVNSSSEAGAKIPALTIQQRNGKPMPTKEVPLLGTTEELESVIEACHPKEILIALGTNEHDKLIDLISRASHSNVGLKIVPDLYDIVSGQARTREIYGFPLIDINPVLLSPWEESAKRMLDVSVSALILAVGTPVWLLIAASIRLSSSGPIIYTQERLGKDGRRFHIFKFRSMYLDAESGGPQWASKNDPRVTPLGRFLRKSHLDEVPQLWNVLKGDMSLVGPRPEREFFVKQLLREVPYYERRQKVRPGVTGLYQTAVHKYDENIEDVKQKVKYDLMYIESMSFRLDVKILLRTVYMMMRGKGQA